MIRLRNNKAITLIALVITIVVLIILAAVAINMSLGNNGIFNRAKSAKEQYSNKQVEEQTIISEVSNSIDSYTTYARAGGNPINYSTEEQVIGTWINGKPLYQKTISCRTPTAANSVQNIADLPANYDTIFIVNNFFLTSNAVTYLSGTEGALDRIWLRTKNNPSGVNKISATVYDANYVNCPLYVTLQYTKTTD